MGLKCKVCLFASIVKVPKGRRTLVVTDDREPERGVDVEVIGIEEKCVVPRVNSAEGEESGLKSEYTEHAINTMQVYTYIRIIHDCVYHIIILYGCHMMVM